MALTKEKACYKAVRRAVAVINSAATPKEGVLLSSSIENSQKVISVSQ